MPHRPLPPPYTSSNNVLNGIAAAFSVFNNPRGLECLWNSPYGQTFRELVDSYAEGPFLVYSPYKLWLPGLVRKELLLRSEFADLNIEYDIIPTVRVCEMKAKASIEARNSVRPSPPTGFTQRTRKLEEKRMEKMISDAEIEKIVDQLRKRRLAIIKKQEDLEKKKNVPHGFDDSLESNPDTPSFEQEPDIVVTHMAAAILPDEPRFQYRAYRKPYYQRAAILAELKQGASRSLKVEGLINAAANTRINEAINDMIDYCSSYFACYPDAMSVIAVVAGGQMWRWAEIKRSQTPRWDFMLNTANRTSPKNVELLLEWHTLFNDEDPPFQLGTPESDQQLTIINQKHLYPLLAQTPPVPDYLLLGPREGEESVNEGDGNQETEKEKGEREIEEEDEEEGSIEDSDDEQDDSRNDRGRWPEDDN